MSRESHRPHVLHNHGHGLGLNGGSIRMTIPENALCEIRGCRVVKVVAVPSARGRCFSAPMPHSMCPCRIPRDESGSSDCSDRMLPSLFESCLTRCQCLGTPRRTRQHSPRQAAGNAWRFRCLQCNTPAGGEGDITTSILVWFCGRILKNLTFLGGNPNSHPSVDRNTLGPMYGVVATE